MRFGEFCKAMLEVSLIGPRLSLRTAEVMVAATQVLTSRMTVFAGAVTKPSVGAGLEFNLMIREKVEASNEAMTAAVNFFARAKQSAATPSLAFSLPFSQRTTATSKQNKNLWQTMAGSLSFLSWLISLPVKVTLGAVDFFTQVTAPLYSRLMANAARLQAKKR